MAEPSLVFPAEEYRGRTQRLQQELARRDIAALLLTTAADVFYVTGFLTRFWESPARPWFVIVPASGDPVAVIPSIGAALMAQTWISDIRTWQAPDPNDSGVGLLAETLGEVTEPGSSIGIPMGLETQLRMPLADYHELTRSFRVVDATDCVQRVREIKSDHEIAAIRDTCTIAGRAFDRVPEFAAAGIGLDAVFRAFQVALLEEGADWVSYVAGAAGPGGYGDVISPAQETPLQPGDVLMLDCGAVRRGYFCDFDRNFAVGPVSPKVRNTHAALWTVTEQVLSEIRPGLLASEVHKMLSDGLQKEGAEPGEGRLGHGLGISLTEWPSFTPLDHTPLRAGMVLTIEPGALIEPGRMMVHEENFVLRETGAELLSPRAPQTLPVIGL